MVIFVRKRSYIPFFSNVAFYFRSENSISPTFSAWTAWILAVSKGSAIDDPKVTGSNPANAFSMYGSWGIAVSMDRNKKLPRGKREHNVEACLQKARQTYNQDHPEGFPNWKSVASQDGGAQLKGLYNWNFRIIERGGLLCWEWWIARGYASSWTHIPPSLLWLVGPL